VIPSLLSVFLLCPPGLAGFKIWAFLRAVLLTEQHHRLKRQLVTATAQRLPLDVGEAYANPSCGHDFSITRMFTPHWHSISPKGGGFDGS
jgi:hypothetical protein